MFRLVRFFLLTSAAAVIALVVAFVVYRQGEEQRLIEFAEQQNLELARSVARIIWPEIASFVMSAASAHNFSQRSVVTPSSVTPSVLGTNLFASNCTMGAFSSGGCRSHSGISKLQRPA